MMFNLEREIEMVACEWQQIYGYFLQPEMHFLFLSEVKCAEWLN